jgi:hypothetical protein
VICTGEAKQKVQFLKPDNDDMMKKVYVMAQKYMNYNANEFSSVWTKVVLSEKELFRNNYILFRNNPKSRNFTLGILSICDIRCIRFLIYSRNGAN